MKIIYLPHYKENKELGLEAIDKLSVKDPDDAGIDLRAAIRGTLVLNPGESYVIPSGVKIHIGSHDLHKKNIVLSKLESFFDRTLRALSNRNDVQPLFDVVSNILKRDKDEIGVYGAIAPRSGLGFKHFLRLANTIGIIDANYQGEIMIKIRNEGDDVLTIERGDRICQLIFHTYVKNVTFEEVEDFDEETERGEGGFGRSGVK
ncbi:deoxyuridine 5'-triphosphate nucleotidohydrolase [Vibrio phage nt-1]|uniref:dUTP diphosphatase n=1 Tax=Vibrio phage nt-1 TaxID=115992 RepID=R9TIZ9_9CAUD|nr:dUTPase [Vibrio phage nt-1]AGN30072.1 deoxyuridine 5'-triphosphate nucleotidohydrolase [Vibrio phage nt-1]